MPASDDADKLLSDHGRASSPDCLSETGDLHSLKDDGGSDHESEISSSSVEDWSSTTECNVVSPRTKEVQITKAIEVRIIFAIEQYKLVCFFRLFYQEAERVLHSN